MYENRRLRVSKVIGTATDEFYRGGRSKRLT
jgi:hypothetical protein